MKRRLFSVVLLCFVYAVGLFPGEEKEGCTTSIIYR
ncbi:MAG: hypothetical protein QG657_5912, partial [Acidobacteriota bacterium]|nr:hypothetical protein [Acidobacteriota bacterium]